MTHPEWRLDLVWNDGKRPLLVAHRRDKRRAGARGSRSRGAGIQEGTPIFALEPFIAQRNAVALVPEIRKAEKDLPLDFIAAAAGIR